MSDTPDLNKPPPIKLTLPKPAMYPYSRSSLTSQNMNNTGLEAWNLSPFSANTVQPTSADGGAVLKLKIK